MIDLKSTAVISEILKSEVSASSITNLNDRFLNDKEASGPRRSRYASTDLISQMALYLDFGGVGIKNSLY